jgi:hypothetical protein
MLGESTTRGSRTRVTRGRYPYATHIPQVRHTSRKHGTQIKHGENRT